MGKNANQIATFADLYSIGYRVPSGKENSKECITYADLRTMSDMNNVVLYHSYYNNENVFQVRYTSDFQGTTLSGNTWITSLLGWFNTPSCDLNTKISYFPYLYPSFTITAPQPTTLKGNMTLRLFIEDQSGNIQILDSITHSIAINSGTTAQNGGWTQKSSNQFTWQSSTSFDYDYTQLQIKPNTTYDIKLQVYFAPETMYTQYGPHNISFVSGHSSSDIKYYSANKCVPWQYVKGSSGQLTENGIIKNPAKILVDCKLTETITLSNPDILYLGFIYHYIQNGSEKKYTITSWSDFEVADDTTFEVHLPINLKTDSAITDDWLEIVLTADTGAASHYYKFSVIIDGETQTKTSSKTNGRTTMTISGRYNDVVRGLESINIKIYN